MFLTAFLLAPALLAAPAAAQDWTVDHEASTVGFETQAMGGTINGTFSNWSADITLDPHDLDAATIAAEVVTASADTGNGEVDRSLLSSAGLAPDTHETATFVSDDIRATNDGYAAHGSLTIKGQARDVVLPFTLAISDGRAVADGTLDIARTDFGVGGSSWGDAGAAVTLVLHIEADAAD